MQRTAAHVAMRAVSTIAGCAAAGVGPPFAQPARTLMLLPAPEARFAPRARFVGVRKAAHPQDIQTRPRHSRHDAQRSDSGAEHSAERRASAPARMVPKPAHERPLASFSAPARLPEATGAATSRQQPSRQRRSLPDPTARNPVTRSAKAPLSPMKDLNGAPLVLPDPRRRSRRKVAPAETSAACNPGAARGLNGATQMMTHVLNKRETVLVPLPILW